MYYTQKSRSSVVIDLATCDPKTLHHGRVLWLKRESMGERELMYWDSYEKRVVSSADFRQLRIHRAAANREKHAMVPFGRKTRRARAVALTKGTACESLSSSSLGWAAP